MIRLLFDMFEIGTDTVESYRITKLVFVIYAIAMFADEILLKSEKYNMRLDQLKNNGTMTFGHKKVM